MGPCASHTVLLLVCPPLRCDPLFVTARFETLLSVHCADTKKKAKPMTAKDVIRTQVRACDDVVLARLVGSTPAGTTRLCLGGDVSAVPGARRGEKGQGKGLRRRRR